MKATKRVVHHVSMGNYEFVEFSAEITYDTEEMSVEEVNILLDDILAEDIKEARLNTDVDSYIKHYKED